MGSVVRGCQNTRKRYQATPRSLSLREQMWTMTTTAVLLQVAMADLGKSTVTGAQVFLELRLVLRARMKCRGEGAPYVMGGAGRACRCQRWRVPQPKDDADQGGISWSASYQLATCDDASVSRYFPSAEPLPLRTPPESVLCRTHFAGVTRI